MEEPRYCDYLLFATCVEYMEKEANKTTNLVACLTCWWWWIPLWFIITFYIICINAIQFGLTMIGILIIFLIILIGSFIIVVPIFCCFYLYMICFYDKIWCRIGKSSKRNPKFVFFHSGLGMQKLICKPLEDDYNDDENTTILFQKIYYTESGYNCL